MSLNIRLLKIILINYPLAKKMKAYRSRFAFRIEKKNWTPRHCSAATERQQACATTTRSPLHQHQLPRSRLLLPLFLYFFPFFLHLRPNFILFWHITNIGYSSQRLEQPRSAIGSWSIRRDYSDTQNLSETASVSKIAIKINQVILF